MRIKRLETKYLCTREACKSPLTTYRSPFKELSELLEELKDAQDCYSCGQLTMVLVHAILHIDSELTYGDPKFGIWKCDKHITQLYYPTLLKEAIEYGKCQTLQYKTIAETIADVGCPFRCPICKSELKYLDERTLNCAY